MEKNERHIPIPQGLSVEINGSAVTAKGNGRESGKVFSAQGILIEKTNEHVVLRAKKLSNREVSKMNAMVSHIENLFKGVQHDFEYRMSVVFSHFPMTLNVKGAFLEINNFLGEKKMRKAKILPGIKVVVKGKDITVSGASKEKVAQTAANIEGTARVVGRDKRVYQDGIFIVSKGK